jgi:DNA-binding CsgD family transcriptional regulator
VRVTTATADHGGPLNPRERMIATLLLEGASDREIARVLGISVNTAKTYLNGLRARLHASDRDDLVARLRHLG